MTDKRLFLILLLLNLGQISCGVKGPPLPPLVVIPPFEPVSKVSPKPAPSPSILPSGIQKNESKGV
jgi:hypothetical protein